MHAAMSPHGTPLPSAMSAQMSVIVGQAARTGLLVLSIPARSGGISANGIDTTHHQSDRSQLAHIGQEASATLQVAILDVVADRGYFNGEEVMNGPPRLPAGRSVSPLKADLIADVAWRHKADMW